MRKMDPWLLVLVLEITLSLAACAPTPIPGEAATPTLTATATYAPTPTVASSSTSTPTATTTSTSSPPSPTLTATPTQQPLLPGDTPTPARPALCDGLGAEVEVRLSLPYAAAAGLEPIAVGYIPLGVNAEQKAYAVQGTGHISYDETQTWTDEDGKETAEVFLELDLRVEGECVGDATEGELHLALDAIHQEEQGATTCAYPPGKCSHSPVMGPHVQSLELEFPLVDGATVQREDWTSWTFVLHLHSR
jgi:hypothetical protein